METKITKNFPRLSELRDMAYERRLANFFETILNVVSKYQLAREYYTLIENDLSALDELSWHYFRDELISFLPSANLNSERRRQLFDKLFEAKGYVFLKEHVRGDIEFIPCSKVRGQETPELQVLENGQIIALLEVKTVWGSDDERKWIDENTASAKQGKPMKVRRLQPSFPDGLQRKLTDHLKKAESQLTSFPASATCQKYLMFVIHLDHEQANTPGIREKIQDHLKPTDTSITVICNFQGPIFD